MLKTITEPRPFFNHQQTRDDVVSFTLAHQCQMKDQSQMKDQCQMKDGMMILNCVFSDCWL